MNGDAEWNRWRGRVEQALVSIDDRLESIDGSLTTLQANQSSMNTRIATITGSLTIVINLVVIWFTRGGA